MKSILTKGQWLFFAAAMIVTMVVRLVDHPFNFTPVAGLALLGAAYISKRWLAWLLPIAVFWATDLFLNNVVYSAYFDGFVFASTPFMYSAGAILVMVIVGKWLLKKVNTKNIIISSLLASTIFFLISNFGVWLTQPNPYPTTAAGLLTCMEMGIPFYRTAILGDLVFSGVLFGAWALLFASAKQNQLAGKQA